MSNQGWSIVPCEAYAAAMCGDEERSKDRSVPEGCDGWFWCPVATIMRVIEAEALFASFGIGVACKC